MWHDHKSLCYGFDGIENLFPVVDRWTSYLLHVLIFVFFLCSGVSFAVIQERKN